MLTEGAAAPDFELPDLSGTPRTMESLAAGRPLLLAFFHVSCPVCQFTFPFLERIAHGEVRIAGISQDDAGSTAEFNSEFGITFAAVIENPCRDLSNAYRVTNVPTLFLIEKGAISMAVTGFSKAALEALGKLAGLNPFFADELIPAFRPG